jgi:hypothetical protein
VTEPQTTAVAPVEASSAQRTPASVEPAQTPSRAASEEPINNAWMDETHAPPSDAATAETEADEPEHGEVIAKPQVAPPTAVVEPGPEAEVDQNEPVAVTTQPKRETVSERIAREDAEGQARHDARLAKLPPELRRKIQELETPPSFGADRSL